MKFMYAGSLMETRYDVGDTIQGSQINEEADYRVINVEIDSDTGGVGYDLEEIKTDVDRLFLDENEIE